MQRIGFFVFLGLFAATPLAAQRATSTTQACTGNPARSGASLVAGAIGFTDNAITYGGGFEHNARGPVAAGFGVAVTDIDNVDIDVVSVGGRLSIELATTPIGVCPVFGATYVKFDDIEDDDDRIEIDGWIFPIGVAFGGVIPSQTGLRVIPFVIPAVEIVHASADARIARFVLEGSDTDARFAIDAGVTLAGDVFFGRVAVSANSSDESDPTLSVGGGIVF